MVIRPVTACIPLAGLAVFPVILLLCILANMARLSASDLLLRILLAMSFRLLPVSALSEDHDRGGVEAVLLSEAVDLAL